MESKNKNFSFISMQCTVLLKGFSIMLVIIGHLFPVHPINYLGAFGVGIFLIISGYGLTESYKKNDKLPNYMKKRFEKVLLPYIFVSILLVFFNALFLGKVIGYFQSILYIFGVNFKNLLDGSMWFIPFILIWYLIFYIIFRLPIHNKLKVLCLFIGSLFLSFFNKIDNINDIICFQFELDAFMFPIGVLLSISIKDIVNKLSLFYYTIINVVVMLTCCILTVLLFPMIGEIFIYKLEIFLFSIGFIAFFNIIDTFSVQIKSIYFLGNISYELYLLEAIVLTYHFKIWKSQNIWFDISYLVILTTLAYLLHILIPKLIKWNKAYAEKNIKRSM